jgi:hypothetical protein
MYLSGLGGQINVQVGSDMRSFFDITTELDKALQAGEAYTTTGRKYTKTVFMGGWLLDGCPLNVIFWGRWLPGQIAALKAAGIMPTCLQSGSPAWNEFYGVSPSASGAGPVAAVVPAAPPAAGGLPAPGTFLPTGVSAPTFYDVIPPAPAPAAGDGISTAEAAMPSWLPLAMIAGLAVVFGLAGSRRR